MSARNRKVGRNDPCPCGSGEKFKKCCLERGLDWRGGKDGDQALHVRVPEHPIQEARKDFIESRGREPKSGDPLFTGFDGVQYSIDIPRLLTKAGIDGDARKFACMVLGFIPVEGKVTGADEESFDLAMEAWDKLGTEEQEFWRAAWSRPVGTPPPKRLERLLEYWELPPRKIRLEAAKEESDGDEEDPVGATEEAWPFEVDFIPDKGVDQTDTLTTILAMHVVAYWSFLEPPLLCRGWEDLSEADQISALTTPTSPGGQIRRHLFSGARGWSLPTSMQS